MDFSCYIYINLTNPGPIQVDGNEGWRYGEVVDKGINFEHEPELVRSSNELKQSWFWDAKKHSGSDSSRLSSINQNFSEDAMYCFLQIRDSVFQINSFQNISMNWQWIRFIARNQGSKKIHGCGFYQDQLWIEKELTLMKK